METQAKENLPRRPSDMSAPKEGNVGAVVLAGTHHYGNGSLDALAPRPLVPVANAPVIAYVTHWLAAGGMREATVCVTDMASAFAECLGDQSKAGCHLRYLEDCGLRGPAGCVRDAAVQLRAERYLVVEATLIPMVDLTDLLDTHVRNAALATVVGIEQSANGTRLLEPVGIYVFERTALEHVHPAGYVDIKETLLPRLYKMGEHVQCYRTSSACPSIRSFESYFAANHWALENADSLKHLQCEYDRIGDAFVHRTARVDKEARLIGQLIIGQDTVIERGATIVGPATIGNRCTIGAHALVGRSILWDECTVCEAVQLDKMLLTVGRTIAATPNNHELTPPGGFF